MPKTLILCFDGTDGQYGPENSNVVKLFSLFAKDQPTEQLCYYQPGIGTYFAPGMVNPAFEWAAKILDEAFAWYLYAHVSSGYQWLMDNHCPGDSVVITGFSRGAYTARALAGFVFKIGLIGKDNSELIPFAYKLYKRTDAEGVALAAGFKSGFARHVDIDFIGVWDTVASVGVIASQNLPFTGSNTGIKVFRHAIALDEHRVRFLPNLWHRDASNIEGAKKDPEHATRVAEPVGEGAAGPSTSTSVHAELEGKYTSLSADNVREAVSRSNRSVKTFGKHMRRAHSEVSSVSAEAVTQIGLVTDQPLPPRERYDTNVLEVFFAGVHADVGGGAALDSTPQLLSNDTLRWMVRELAQSPVPIVWTSGAFEQLGVDLDDEPSGCGVAGNGLDALSPTHDELGVHGHWAWWILECIPLTVAYQNQQGNWVRKLRINFGRGRQICLEHPLFHESVKRRMEDTSLKYSPRAIWTKGSEVYVK